MEPLTRRSFGALTLGALAAFAGARLGSASGATSATKKLIVLWLGGGPSQLETFDPKPNNGPTRAIGTSAPTIQIAAGLPQLAEQMQHLSLVRSVMGAEGDHERASILMKTGRRPEVSLSHPSLGAVCAHELPEAGTEIPRYVSLLGADHTSRGGYLGAAYDPFRVGDPREPLQDLVSPVPEDRRQRRLDTLDALEKGFAERHPGSEELTLHRDRTARALRTMSSEQLAAFRIDDEPRAVRQAYGDTPLGRACLAARRLVNMGVRCVEIAHNGWDTHVDNFNETARLNGELDPALATLVKDLREHDLWESTVVLCTGEFGRTPVINAAEGRDHWPHAFSLVLGGGGIRGGRLVGETSLEGRAREPVPVADVYATVLAALGIDGALENQTPGGRPVKLTEGRALKSLLA